MLAVKLKSDTQARELAIVLSYVVKMNPDYVMLSVQDEDFIVTCGLFDRDDEYILLSELFVGVKIIGKVFYDFVDCLEYSNIFITKDCLLETIRVLNSTSKTRVILPLEHDKDVYPDYIGVVKPWFESNYSIDYPADHDEIEEQGIDVLLQVFK